MTINIVITSVGGEIIPGIIDALRSEKSYEFNIIGVDMNEGAVGQRYTDEFYTVPGGLEPSYVPQMVDVAEKENIDVVVPLSDQETRSLSKNKDEFRSVGTEILTPSSENVETASDKGSMLKYLDEQGVAVPEYYLPNSFSELDKAVSELGYPDKDVIIKPRRQRASRGFWKLSPIQSTQKLMLNNKGLQTLSYKVARDLLEDGSGFPEIVVMEYLNGPHFSVDSLSKDGESIYQIPIKQIKPAIGQISSGRSVHDKKVMGATKEICDTFGFNYNVNLDMAYRNHSDERPLVYEINPRVSGLIAVNSKVGVNLLLFGILLLTGDSIELDKKFEEVEFHRVWNEVYSKK